ncbi:ervatamin-B-like [Lycium ferocissimum]|uniref:ervatamin-B-like n=1 Tax=Lycium ferocissimum TaxID=112874 RepID=UPI002814F9EC|nr:ervatamin-B-like [Lycium ferocissimum]
MAEDPEVHINIPLVELLQEVVKYAKYIKDVVANRMRWIEFEITVALTEKSSRVRSKIPPKLKDPGSFTISITIDNIEVGLALCDLGLGESRPTTITLQLADRSLAYPDGIIEDVLVKIRFHWVGRKLLLDVDNQRYGCCCWAFAATEAITVVYARKNKKVIPLSKQQLLDCMFKYYKIPSRFANLGKKECFPYSCTKAFTFAMHPGIVEESKYPFMEARGECKCPSNVETVKIKGFKNVSELNIKDQKQLEGLIKTQPLTCAVPHVSSLREHRGEEIYMGPTDAEVEEINKLKDRGDRAGLHAMLIVGYGEENGEEFYLVKNSWGKEWGYRGFAKIKRSIASKLSFPIIDRL